MDSALSHVPIHGSPINQCEWNHFHSMAISLLCSPFHILDIGLVSPLTETNFHALAKFYQSNDVHDDSSICKTINRMWTCLNTIHKTIVPKQTHMTCRLFYYKKCNLVTILQTIYINDDDNVASPNMFLEHVTMCL
jgi:hypothetical protein